MTQVFTEDGKVFGVTVIAAGPCTVCQVRTEEKDGYHAVQLGYEDALAKDLRKPQRGQFEKASVPMKRFLREERLAGPSKQSVGDTVTVESFAAGDLVDVIGTTKGRGFSGTIKRHGFQRGPASHGCMNVRQPGSIGTKRTGKLFPGKRMSGHYGHERQTSKNLEIFQVDGARNLLLVKGSVPGPTGGFVQVRVAKTGIKRVVKAAGGSGSSKG